MKRWRGLLEYWVEIFLLGGVSLVIAILLRNGWYFYSFISVIAGAALFGGTMVVEHYLDRARKYVSALSQSFVITDIYVLHLTKKTIIGAGILVLCGAFCVFVGDRTSLIVVLLLIAALAIYVALTWIRCIHGSFADNGFEARELLAFIISNSKSGGIPPGSRAAHFPTTKFSASPIHDEKLARVD